MKIAVISDIHANLLALEAVLNKIKKLNCSQVICLGDLVDYGTQPDEVVEVIKNLKIPTILGNHDHYLVENMIDWPASDNRITRAAHQFSKITISSQNIHFLANLHPRKRINLAGLKMGLYHGSPWNNLEGKIFLDFKNWSRFNKVKNEDLILLGHTHYPFLKRVGKKVIINPGSVGQPRDYEPKASFAVIDTNKNLIKIQRVAFDIGSICQSLKEANLPEELCQTLRRQRKDLPANHPYQTLKPLTRFKIN